MKRLNTLEHRRRHHRLKRHRNFLTKSLMRYRIHLMTAPIETLRIRDKIIRDELKSLPWVDQNPPESELRRFKLNDVIKVDRGHIKLSEWLPPAIKN